MMWQDAINKQISNVCIAFEILDAYQPIPVDMTKASGYIIFNVKMDFTQKARQDKYGHRMPEPMKSTYAGVVSRESIGIPLTYTALSQI